MAGFRKSVWRQWPSRATGGNIAWPRPQLTNILRDIAEDAKRDRLYLPAHLLDKFGIETRDPTEVMRHEALRLYAMPGGGRAQSLRRCHNRHGGVLPAAHATSVLMMLVYRRVLDALMNRGWKDLEKPVKVSKATKLWILIRHGFF